VNLCQIGALTHQTAPSVRRRRPANPASRPPQPAAHTASPPLSPYIPHAPIPRATAYKKFVARRKITKVPYYYQSGEEIKPGDRVFLHGEPSQIDFIADPADPATNPEDWYVTECGGGVMVLEPRCFGRLFLHDPSDFDYEDLEFVSRSAAQ